MQRVHILQLIDGLNVGGAEVLLRDLVSRLEGSRFRISIGYSTPGPLIEQIAPLGVPMIQMPRMGRVDPLLLGRMMRLMRADPPQIVHTHLFKSDFHGRIAARLSGIPVVISTLHNNNDWSKNALLGRLYRLTAGFADRIIAVSEEVREFSLKYLFLNPKQVVTICNGVPIERFIGQEQAGQALRAELGIPADVPLVGIIARLTAQKDHKTFLQAAAQIRRAIPNVHFLITGDGELRSDLEAQTAALNLQNATIFTGVRRDIPAIMASIDLQVFSSAWEGLPVAMLEGMAAARPVVATAVGGVPGALIDGSTGLLVKPGDPTALAEACIRVLGDAALRERMGQAGRARVEAHYSIKAMVEQTIDLYEQMLQYHGLGLVQPSVTS